MATRNLTHQFMELRAQKQGISVRVGGTGSLIHATGSLKGNHRIMENEMDVAKPRWMVIHDKLRNMLEGIRRSSIHTPYFFAVILFCCN